MEGTLIHTLGARKLGLLLAVSIAFFVLFFAIDVLPISSSSKQVKPCEVIEGTKWYDAKSCAENYTLRDHQSWQHLLYLQLPDNNPDLSFYVWNFFLLISFHLDVGIINFDNLDAQDRHNPLIRASFKTDVGYKNFEESGPEWKAMLHSEVERDLSCSFFNPPDHEYNNLMNCDSFPFFELGNVHNDYYLINTNISIKFKRTGNDAGLYIKGAYAGVRYQVEDFTKAMFALKLFLFPVIMIVLVWYVTRIGKFRDQPALIEKSLIALGVTLAILNFPLEWLVIWVNFPSVHLLHDVRLVFFYAAFFYFFSLFIDENQAEKPDKDIKCFGCKTKLSITEISMPFIVVMMLVFHLVNRIVHLQNEFFAMEQTDESANAILAFIATVGTMFGLYSLLQIKNTAFAMRNVLAQHQGAVRIAFLLALAANILAALLTVTYFFVSNFHWFFMKYRMTDMLESGSLYFGVYGAWNLYVVVFMILFAPYTHSRITELQEEQEGGMVEDAKIVDAGIITTNEVWSEDAL